jgi:hypothetical protein
VRSITNCSGTFQCDDRAGLLAVAEAVRRTGLTVEPGGVRFFNWDQTAAVEILQ